MTVRPVIVCFAGDIWDGNPHSRHHLMRRFARRFDVLFVESVPMRAVARGDAHEWRRIVRKLRAGSALRSPEPGLHVLRPPPIPPAGRVGRRAQLSVLRRQVERACRKLGLDGPRVAWFSLPVAAPLCGALGERGSLFYYQDRYDAFSHVDVTRLREGVAALARCCEVSIATAAPLAQDLAELGADPTVVPHGVDVERFAAATDTPADVRDLERPLVGYVGLIDDYLSLESMLAVAERLDRGTLVCVGGSNIDTSPLTHPRIELLGRRPYDDIPAYVNAFDCCIVPFAQNRLTVGVNPIKLREYLAAGRPVVATRLPAIEQYDDVVSLADDAGEFVDAVVQVLSSPDAMSESAARQRRDRVAGESWDEVAARIEPLLWSLAGEPSQTSSSA